MSKKYSVETQTLFKVCLVFVCFFRSKDSGTMALEPSSSTFPTEDEFVALCRDLFVTNDIEKKAFCQLKLLLSAIREQQVCVLIILIL